MKTETINIGIIACPNFALMDVIGVHTIFGVPPCIGLRPNIKIHWIWKKKEILEAIPPLPLRPTMTYDEAPQLDVLAIGAVSSSFYEDEESMQFLASAGCKASYLLGVCVGSLILGAAGLLDGYRATSNFHSLNILSKLGAIPTKDHIVVDRNRYTTGPMIGAYDASLMILSELCGIDVARELELHLEYTPQPPFKTGSPELAGSELTEVANERVGNLMGESHDTILRAAQSFGR